MPPLTQWTTIRRLRIANRLIWYGQSQISGIPTERMALSTHTPLIKGVEVHPLIKGVDSPKPLVLKCFVDVPAP